MKRFVAILIGLVALAALGGLCYGFVKLTDVFSGYVVRGSRPIPGDAAHYDVIATYPQIATFAGVNFHLTRISMKFVKADGTLDLTADYGATVSYYFAHVLDKSAVNGAPVGVNNSTGPLAETAYVSISRPGLKNPNKNQWYDFGMDRSQGTASAWTGTLADIPTCTPKSLWDAAIQKGVSADAVATIDYDATGYRFAIQALNINFRFGADCSLIP
jgi:hypothetical protein